MDRFHLFPQLPTELRAIIWQLAVQPRFITVGTNDHCIPAVLQACSESRSLTRPLFTTHGGTRLSDGGKIEILWHAKDILCIKNKTSMRMDLLALQTLYAQSCGDFPDLNKSIRRVYLPDALGLDIFWYQGREAAAFWETLRLVFPNLEQVLLDCAGTLVDWK